MVSEYLRTNSSEGGINLNLSLPEDSDGFKQGFVYRFCVMLCAALFCAVLCLLWGLLNGWHVTNTLIAFVGLSFSAFVLIGEHIRRSAYEDPGISRWDHINIDEIHKGLHLRESLRDEKHEIFDEAAWQAGLYVDEILRRSTYFRFGKRVVDIALSALAIILGMPLLIIAALLVLLENRGSIFERVAAYGPGGKEIRLFRFSTSTRRGRADAYKSFWRQRSFRSPISSLLVRTGLQRAPELFSVLKGDLSLVGPEARYFDSLEDRIPWRVRPGLTGLAKLSGYDWGESGQVRFIDRYYLLSVSPGLDLAILMRSFLSGLYAAQ